MTCPACNHQNLPGAKFCAECGAVLNSGCVSCGATLTPNAKFCHECGTPVAGAARPTAPAGARKVVSILFADLVGSTGLHERLDPESTRRFMESYYDVARKAVESNGGKVTQFLGDGVKAVFGVPRIAEDDAYRAVKAAVEMQEGFRALAEQQKHAVGDTGLRVAVNTGEVVAEGETEIIGDPVNVAARLQEHGKDGDVVIGESTEHLVATQVTLELLGAFDLKGRSGTVKAYRVVSLESQHAKLTPFVGREKELKRITAVYDQATSTSATKMAVLLGQAGLGKSRLIGEFARRSATQFSTNASVIQAHCDAAKGATFAPLADALRKHLALDADASTDEVKTAVETALEATDDHKRIGSGIVGLLTGLPGSPEETFFVVRRFLASLTKARPVVLIVDDLQWAEPLLFDLVEHLVQWGKDLPLFILIGARPELREVRSAFGKAGGFVTDALTLEGLDASASMQLAAGVIGSDELPAAVAAKVLATSEGNPLFISELIRMLVVEGALIEEDGEWRAGETLATVEMPPTIHALLASRIERLDPLDRAILERAAVIGRQFSRNAVTALLPNDPEEIDTRLEALQRFELIERGTGWYIGDPVLRFHHVLIRDAAYRRLLKGTRAELHAKLADWIEAQVGDAQEHDETIGRHLEDAHRLLGELGPLDDAGEKLGERAATRLASAGRRALEADDVPLAAGLLGRALERLRQDDPGRADLCIDWCESLLAEGEVSTAQQAIDELGRLMENNERLQAWHDCFVGQHTVLTAPRELTATVTSVSAAAQKLASLEDSAGEAKAHYVHALALSRQGQIGACEAALDQALAAARKANDRRQANTVLAIAPIAALWGPSPVTRASGRCLDVVRVLRITQGAPAVEAVALMCQGVLEALRGRSEAAHRMIESGREMVEELGIAPQLRNADAFTGYVHLLEGDLTTAEAKLRSAYEGLRDLGLGIDAARAAALLAKTLLSKGEIEEAKTLSHESEQLAGDDLKAAIAWRGVRAEALAGAGEHEDAIKLARKAVSIAEKTDALLDHADARQALAVALRASGQTQEANAEEQRARKLWDDKGATLLLDAREESKREETGDRPRISEGKRGLSPVSQISAKPEKMSQRNHVIPNAVFKGIAKFEACAKARDWQGLRTVFHDDAYEIDHQNGIKFTADELVSSTQLLFGGEGVSFWYEPIATLGSRHYLGWRRMTASAGRDRRIDVANYEITSLSLVEVDDDGLYFRGEVFAPNKLGDAIERMFDLYVESLPEGTERDKAANIAHFARITHGPIDADRFVAHFADDIVLHDYRTVGVGEISGKEAASQPTFVLVNELTENLHVRVTDIYAWNLDGMLIYNIGSGIDRQSGGEFERVIWQLCTFNDKGQVQRWEQFDPEHKEQAIARFHELTGGRVPASGEEKPVQIKLRPAVSPNFLTSIHKRAMGTLEARDFDAFRALFAEDFTETYHPTCETWDLDAAIKSMQMLFGCEDTFYHYEVLATLGPNLQLGTRHYGASGTTGKGLDVGAFEDVIHEVAFADETGIRKSEGFAENKLGDAIVRLYELYAESLPEGPERNRQLTISRFLNTANGPLDFEGFAAGLAPDLQAIDHRTVGFGTLTNGESVANATNVLVNELSKDVSYGYADVAALTPDAALFLSTSTGTDCSSGGKWERAVWELIFYDDTGLAKHWERFEEHKGDEALARFEELTGSTATQPTHAEKKPDVITGLLPQGLERLARGRHQAPVVFDLPAACNARDWDAALDCFSEDYIQVSHSTGSTMDRDEVLKGVKSLFRVPDAEFHNGPLVRLGERLYLLWRYTRATGTGSQRFDVGEYDLLMYHVCELDEQGRCWRDETFSENRLGDAVARLYQRYAESLPDGPDQAKAQGLANMIREATGPIDPQRLKPFWSDNVQLVDYRTAGMGTVEGADAVTEAISVMAVELTEDFTGQFDDVVSLKPDALLCHYTTGGKGQLSGGDFEQLAWYIMIADEQGKIARWEIFEEEQLEQARARFEELTGGERPASITQEKVGITIRPGVQPNEMTNFMTDFVAALKQGDFDWLRRMFPDSYREIDHPTGSTIDKAGTIASLERLFRSEEPYYQVEVLATLGKSLQLGKHVFGASSAASKNFDVGAYENVRIQIDDRNEGCEVFDTNHLGDALIRLYERYAESLPEGSERNTASAISTFIKLGLVWNLKEVVALLAPDIQYVDHRHAGVGELNSPDALINIGKVLKEELTNNLQVRIEDVLRILPNAFLWYYVDSGTDKRSGGDFERHVWDVIVFNDDGLVSHWDRFEHEHKDRALARFEELTGDTKPEPVKPIIQPNLATEATKHALKTIVERNWEAGRAYLHDDLVETDHTNGVSIGPDQMMSSVQLLFHGDNPVYHIEPLATLGPHLMLALRKISSSGAKGKRFDVGEYENTTLHLAEYDDENRMCHAEVFAENKLGEAVIRLYELYAESLPEGAERTRAFGIAEINKAYLGPIDYERFVPCLAPDVVQHDHRHVGSGTLSGAEDVANATRVTLIELTENMTGTMDGLLGLRPEGSLFHFTNTGTLRNSGGEFERNTWEILLHDDAGLLSHWERFDSKDADKALARFEELTGGTKPKPVKRIVRPNQATACCERAVKAIAEQNWDELRRGLHDDLVEIDHSMAARLSPDEMISSVQLLFKGEDPVYQEEPLATLGPHLMLALRSISSSGAKGQRFDVGAYSHSAFHLLETDDEGRLRHAEVFAENKLGDAVARLYACYAESLPEGPERDRAVMTAHCAEWTATDSKKYAMEDVVDPDAKGVDHRLTGHEEVGQYRERYIKSWKNLSRDRTFSINDVLALNKDGILRSTTEKGTWEKTGGEYENEMLILSTFGADGKGNRSEYFDIDKVNQALARFEELTGGFQTTETARADIASLPPSAGEGQDGGGPAATHPHPSPPPQAGEGVVSSPKRRVTINAALEVVSRVVETTKAQDWPALRACFSDDYSEHHYPTGSTFGPDDHVASFQRLFRSENPYYEEGFVASLGDSLGLIWMKAGASGAESKRYSVGPYEQQFYILQGVNDQQQYQEGEVFAENKLGDALARLYERYAGSLPDGPDKKRAVIATALMRFYPSMDLKALAELASPNIEYFDHRNVGTGKLVGRDTVISAIRVMTEDLTENLRGNVHDVLCLQPDAFLIQYGDTGTDKRSGGAFERRIWDICLLGEDGLISHYERFDEDKADQALARFDELTQEKPATTQQRRITPNLVTRFMERWIEETSANNWTAVRALAADDYQEIDHPNGITFSADELVSSIERLYRSDEPYAHYEVLATLGPYLYLGWRQYGASGAQGRRYQVGPYEHKVLQVLEADENGLGKRGEIFSENKLGDALVRLYELYAEKMPEGRERQKWLRLAEGMSHANGKLDIDRMAPNFASDMQMVDHRVVGVGTLQGAEAVLNALNMIVTELAENVKGHIDDIRGLHENASLYLLTTTGTDRRSGGVFERQIWELMVTDDDGMLVHWERFEPEHLDRALARFDELTADTQPVPAQHQIQGNAASAMVERADKLFKAGDWDSFMPNASDDYIEIHHPTGSSYGREETAKTMNRLLRAQDPFYQHTLLATLGPRLCLCKGHFGASGDKSQKYDVGPFESVFISIWEVNQQGDVCRAEVFADNKLGDALVRIYELYAESLPEGPERDRASRIASTMTMFNGPVDIKHMPKSAAPSYKCVDHRIYGTWTSDSIEKHLLQFSAQIELVSDFACRLDEVIELTPQATCLRFTYYGTDRTSGGLFENCFCGIQVWDANGQISLTEVFEREDIEKARARFRELTGEADDETGTEPSGQLQDKITAYFSNAATSVDAQDNVTEYFHNTATRAVADASNAYRIKDWEKFAEYVTEDVTLSDRRALLRIEVEGRDQWLEYARQMGDMPITNLSDRILATRGERLSLRRIDFEGSGGDIGLSEISLIELSEANEAGKVFSMIRFDVDDIDAAYAELDERFLNEEAAAYPAHTASVLNWKSAFEAHDWDALAQIYSDDLIATDHRLVGWGEFRGPAGLVDAHRTYVELAPDLKMRFEHIRFNRRGMLGQGLWYGTRDGGAFENMQYAVGELNGEGRICRWDIYDERKLEQALARFNELSSDIEPEEETLSPEDKIKAYFANDATQGFEEATAAYRIKDWTAFAEYFADDAVLSDKRPILRVDLEGKEKVLEYFRPTGDLANTKVTQTMIATRGEHLAIRSLVYEGSGGDIGPSEFSALDVIEVNNDGQVIAFIRFDLNDMDAACAELDERYSNGEGAAYPTHFAWYIGWKSAFEARDWDRLAQLYSDDLIATDHRLVSWGELRDPAIVAKAHSDYVELAPDLKVRFEHIRNCPRGIINQSLWFGTRDGGEFENSVLNVVELNNEGRLCRLDLYDLNKFDEALARFQELIAESDATEVATNVIISKAIAQAMGRWLECYRLASESGDWEPMRELLEPDLVFKDLRRMALLEGDADLMLAGLGERAKSGAAIENVEFLKAAGEHLTLSRIFWAGGPPDGRFEIEYLAVIELSEEGLVKQVVFYDLDDDDKALALFEELAKVEA